MVIIEYNREGCVVPHEFVFCRDDLLGQDSKQLSEINRTSGLDNYGLVGLQRQIMKGLVVNNFLFIFCH